MKWKRRPSVDLVVTATVTGVGKYLNLIGSLVMEDSEGRTVSVGSGMSDEDREKPSSYWIGKVVEVYYEQIIHTYIQPTFGSNTLGVTIREDKTIKDID
jgi:ATP-dependent DNA ligase